MNSNIEIFEYNAYQILVDVGFRPDLLDGMVKGLVAYYTINRYYHNVDHINYMIDRMDDAGWYSEDLAFAVLFHDVYYKPGFKYNEQYSAVMAEQVLNLCSRKLPIVIPLIIETANFMKVSKNKSDIFYKICDLDLSSLARTGYHEFVEQQKMVLKEFGETDLSKSAKFLKKLVEVRGDCLYYTDYANENWKPFADQNITKFVNEYC